MKTFRQNLHIWLEEQKNTSNNDEVIEMLTNVQKHIKNVEKEEEMMVNNAYDSGYYDNELKRGKKSNYYQLNFKLHDKLKKMINLN
jgi:hypothetical protein